MIIAAQAVLVLMAAAAPTCKTADARVEDAIAGKSRELNGQEYCQFRIYETLSDLDGDGIDDFVVVFTVEGAGGGGNNSTQYLLVLASRSGWQPVEARVGARGERTVESVEVSKGTLRLHVLKYGRGDAMCCPSRPASVRYRLAGRTLTEE